MPQSEVAIAHDYLTQRGGAERVVLALARAFPDAPIYTTLYEPNATFPEFAEHNIQVSWLNRIPAFRRSHRLALPFLGVASSRMTVDAKLTIASSSGWAHGFTSTGAKIVYCYSPARWLYQPDAYLGVGRSRAKRLALRALGPSLRRWDRKQAASATKYFAISTAVRDRIWDTYKIDAEVLPAPHSMNPELAQEPLDLADLPGSPDGFYLCISRLLPYKNVDVVIEAMNLLGLPLVVVGAGPDERRLRALAGPCVRLLQNLTDGQIRWLYANCTAVLAASYEDFGLTPIEAAAYGKPSVVLRWGGFLDTILEGKTGIYFDQPVPELVSKAVLRSRETTWNTEVLKHHANLFSEDRFASRLIRAVAEVDTKR